MYKCKQLKQKIIFRHQNLKWSLSMKLVEIKREIKITVFLFKKILKYFSLNLQKKKETAWMSVCEYI